MLFKHLLSGGALAALLTGCACSEGPTFTAQAPGQYETDEIAQASPSVKANHKAIAAVAHIKPVQGNRVQGKVIFTKVPDGIEIVADFEGLSPGKHGFHIHEHGSCGGKEAAEAGAHYNPTDQPHAGPDNTHRHVGDLGNLIADENGHAHYKRIDKVITLEGKNSIIGRSIIVHADPDDYTSQPAGASGAKIACGIIEAVSIQ